MNRAHSVIHSCHPVPTRLPLSNCSSFCAEVRPETWQRPLSYLTVAHLLRYCAAANSKSATQAQHQVKSALLLDVVVAECAAIFQLLAGKDQALLVRGDALLVLDLLVLSFWML
eukprot:TRINITY_DN415_c0_g1_i23.p1 TRINITY_DN415_c0_g1~~TRINITY_DN415_c0_g1_i23.p1  ORF type:complete len:114 (+),score=12.60 TRINITY_DN415_c0_g1_i23:299-640(+)